ncbi:MAG TPA: UDP-N-acetylglucosamine 2-epimerase [Candidatus Limosilactobacillus gallistercoris]|nr:UDP-N-acetylglucosamine 2-epimerase [Candidatus Limosilactobacillus gallistercoris]
MIKEISKLIRRHIVEFGLTILFLMGALIAVLMWWAGNYSTTVATAMLILVLLGTAAGTLKLVGTKSADVKTAMLTLLNDDQQYQQMAKAKNPYGDGHAAERIVDQCKQFITQDIM